MPKPTTESPRTRVLDSTPVPGSVTRPDGTVTAATITVVHTPGAEVPDRLDLTTGTLSTGPAS